MHYVILGNGLCGMEAALALRRRDPEARISLISDEHDHFFSRPALMYVFCGQLDLRATEPYDRGLYERSAAWPPSRTSRPPKRGSSFRSPRRACSCPSVPRFARSR
jgi:NADPH-dependent 2,4-dienoyl-CoA reductase/sulfur reductase-like enzyme